MLCIPSIPEFSRTQYTQIYTEYCHILLYYIFTYVATLTYIILYVIPTGMFSTVLCTDDEESPTYSEWSSQAITCCIRTWEMSHSPQHCVYYETFLTMKKTINTKISTNPVSCHFERKQLRCVRDSRVPLPHVCLSLPTVTVG